MWFKIQLDYFHLPIFMCHDETLMWRLVNIGQLLGKSNPYTWAGRLSSVTVRDVILSNYHKDYKRMELNSLLIPTEKLMALLYVQYPQVWERLDQVVRSRMVEIQPSYNTYSYKSCAVLGVSDEGFSLEEFVNYNVGKLIPKTDAQSVLEAARWPDDESVAEQERTLASDKLPEQERTLASLREELVEDSKTLASLQDDLAENERILTSLQNHNVASNEEPEMKQEPLNETEQRLGVMVFGASTLPQMIYLPEERYKLNLLLKS